MEFKKKIMYKYLLLLSIGSVISIQAWRTLFNNFAVEVAGVDSFGVGLIQSLRETPGFLAFSVIYILYFIKEHRLAAYSVLFMGIGIAITGFFPNLTGMIVTTFIMSIGFHYFETVNQSLTLQYFSKKETPFVMAQLRKFSSLASIITGGAVFLMVSFFSFKTNYIVFGIVSVGAGFIAMRINPSDSDLPHQHKKIILRKKYWLYYVLTFLSGARRQVFMVFAAFLMVENFKYSVAMITLLFSLNNLVNFFWLPQIAKFINRFGEKNILIAEYIGLIIVFTVYAFTKSPLIVAIFYILDNMIFNFSMALKTYFQKVADPSDIAPTAGVSFTINHIAAIVIPVLGGVLWKIDYRIPFLLGGGIGLLSLGFSFYLPQFSEEDYE